MIYYLIQFVHNHSASKNVNAPSSASGAAFRLAQQQHAARRAALAAGGRFAAAAAGAVALGLAVGFDLVGFAVSNTLICLDNVTVGYERHPVLHHLNASIDEGALLALVGPNGGGKSTLLKTITGDLPLMQGSCTLARAAQPIAVLAQQKTLDTDFPITVFDMAALGLWRQSGAFGRLTTAQREQVWQALERVGIAPLAQYLPNELSGGQLQRVRFARLILQDAPLVLLDEPFDSIDSQTTDELLDLVQEWHRAGKTVICVSHDFSRVRTHFAQAMLLARELIAYGSPEAVLSDALLAQAQQVLDENVRRGPEAAICPQAG